MSLQKSEMQIRKLRMQKACSNHRRKDTTSDCLRATFDFWDYSSDDEWYYIQRLWYKGLIYFLMGPLLSPLCLFYAFGMLVTGETPNFDNAATMQISEQDGEVGIFSWNNVWYGWSGDLSLYSLPFYYLLFNLLGGWGSTHISDLSIINKSPEYTFWYFLFEFFYLLFSWDFVLQSFFVAATREITQALWLYFGVPLVADILGADWVRWLD